MCTSPYIEHTNAQSCQLVTAAYHMQYTISTHVGNSCLPLCSTRFLLMSATAAYHMQYTISTHVGNSCLPYAVHDFYSCRQQLPTIYSTRFLLMSATTAYHMQYTIPTYVGNSCLPCQSRPACTPDTSVHQHWVPTCLLGAGHPGARTAHERIGWDS